jgi:hypothetical protein
MPILINPVRGDIIQTDDPTEYLKLGYRDPTDAELEHATGVEKYGSFEQQAQAQGERVLRGLTFGAVEGFGAPEDIQGRADVSREESPITSFAADVLPDVGVAALSGGLGGVATGAGRLAGREAIAGGAGLIRAGLAAGRAGGAAALAGESIGTGLVGAGQQAFAEGRDFADDPGKFAEDALIWGGLNFGLGAAALRGAGRVEREAVEEGAESLDDIARAAEFRAPKETSAAIDGAPAIPAEPEFVPLEQQLDDGLAAAEGTPAIDRARARAGQGGAVSFTKASVKAGEPGPGGIVPVRRAKDPVPEGMMRVYPDTDGNLWREAVSDSDPDGHVLRRATEDELEYMRLSSKDSFHIPLDDGPEAGNVNLGQGPNFSLGDVASSPMGAVVAGGLGAAAGGAIGGDTESMAAGGALGFGAALLGGRFGRAGARATRAEAAAIRQGEREAVEGGMERALRNASKSDADDLVQQAVRAPVPEAEANSFGRQRRLYINRVAIQEVATREMQQDLSKLVEDVSQVTRADKLASIATSVSDNLSAQRSVADGIAKDAAKFAGELRAEARAYGAVSGKKGLQYAIPGQKSWTIALMDQAREIEGASTGKALFEALDTFKRSAQDFKVSLETGALNSANPIHHQQLIPRIEAFATKIRSALEDSGTWGKAGDMQRAYNAVISDKLLPSWRIFEEKTLQRTHKGYDGMWNVEGWESKLSALLKDADPGARRHVGAVLDAMDELASVRRQFGDPATAGRIQDGVAKVRRTIGLADEVTDATERMKALGELVGGVPYGGMIAGGLAGGFPGAAIGAALPGAVRGFVMGDLISAFQRLSGATEAAVGRGVDDWIRSSRVRGSGIKGLTSRLPLSDEAKQLAKVAARRGVSQSMALFMGDDGSPHAAFERLRDNLLNDDKFYQSIQDEYGTLADESPETFMALGARASAARQFLIARMPPNVSVSVANPNGYPPSREGIEDWAEYVNTVRYPSHAMKNVGGLSMQAVETLREVYPRQYELLQQKTLEGISRAQSHGEKLDDNFLIRVGLLFPDADGVGSPVFSKEFGGVVRDYNAMQKQKGGRSGAPMKPSELSNPGASVMQNGATYGTGF